MLFYFFERERLSHNGNVPQNVFLVLILEGVLFIWPTTSSSEICLNKVFFFFFYLPADYVLLGIYESILASVGVNISHFNHSQIPRKEPNDVSQPRVVR